jgi:hypothetical protein
LAKYDVSARSGLVCSADLEYEYLEPWAMDEVYETCFTEAGRDNICFVSREDADRLCMRIHGYPLLHLIRTTTVAIPVHRHSDTYHLHTVIEQIIRGIDEQVIRPSDPYGISYNRDLTIYGCTYEMVADLRYGFLGSVEHQERFKSKAWSQSVFGNFKEGLMARASEIAGYDKTARKALILVCIAEFLICLTDCGTEDMLGHESLLH